MQVWTTSGLQDNCSADHHNCLCVYCVHSYEQLLIDVLDCRITAVQIITTVSVCIVYTHMSSCWLTFTFTCVCGCLLFSVCCSTAIMVCVSSSAMIDTSLNWASIMMYVKCNILSQSVKQYSSVSVIQCTTVCCCVTLTHDISDAHTSQSDVVMCLLVNWAVIMIGTALDWSGETMSIETTLQSDSVLKCCILVLSHCLWF